MKKYYRSILNTNFEFIDFIDYGYVQNYIFYFATIFQATLYGGMLGNFAEGSAPAHKVFCLYLGCRILPFAYFQVLVLQYSYVPVLVHTVYSTFKEKLNKVQVKSYRYSPYVPGRTRTAIQYDV